MIIRRFLFSRRFHHYYTLRPSSSSTLVYLQLQPFYLPDSISCSPSFQVCAHQPYTPGLVTSLITERVSRGGSIRGSRRPSKIWMGTRCFWCLLLTGPAADRHLPSRGISSANSMSLRHIITLRSTGSLLARLTFTKKTCAFCCLLSFTLDATRGQDRLTTSPSMKYFQLKQNLDIEETSEMNIKQINWWLW